MLPPSERSHEVKARLQRLCTRLPFCRADLVPVRVDELACLHLAQQLIGIAADIARIDLQARTAAIRLRSPD